jgi:hypothetical protein
VSVGQGLHMCDEWGRDLVWDGSTVEVEGVDSKGKHGMRDP